MISLLLFEDPSATNLLPLTWTRPVWDLRCGAWTLRHAIEDAYSFRATHLHTRPHLAEVVRERTILPVNSYPESGMVLAVNGRLLADRTLPRKLPMLGDPCRYLSPDGILLGAWLSAGQLQEGWDTIETLPVRTLSQPLITWVWDLVSHNSARLSQQNARYALGDFPAFQGVYLLNSDQIYIHPTATVQPGVVLDATGGPIVIDEKATVMATAVIQGPTYVGKGSAVKIGARIYHGTSIGPVCKVGGEVEESIFQAYSNKQHDGFLGNSFLGEWCNLGAGTSNSDLKNNYSTVSVWAKGELRDTEKLFVGLFMADHSKSAINSSFNSGTVVGVACNLFGAGFPPKYIPSFSWGGAEGFTDHRLTDALTTAERVMARRNMVLSAAERRLLEGVFEGRVERTSREEGC